MAEATRRLGTAIELARRRKAGATHLPLAAADAIAWSLRGEAQGQSDPMETAAAAWHPSLIFGFATG